MYRTRAQGFGAVREGVERSALAFLGQLTLAGKYDPLPRGSRQSASAETTPLGLPQLPGLAGDGRLGDVGTRAADELRVGLLGEEEGRVREGEGTAVGRGEEWARRSEGRRANGGGSGSSCAWVC